MKIMSTLQRKGALTLCLIVLAETASASAAADPLFWKSNNNSNNNKHAKKTSGGQQQQQQQCPSERINKKKRSLVGSFLSSLGGPPRAKKQQQQHQPQSLDPNCDSVCAHCVPRGGHTHAGAGSVLTAATTTPYNWPLYVWKILFQVFLTTLNVLCWYLPLQSNKISQNQLALSLANAFSGGVFLSLAFGHLIPECVHGFEQYNEVTPYMLVLAGYLIIFFVEKVAFDAHDLLHQMEDNNHNDNHKHNTHNGETTAAANSGRSAVILLGALAVHSILEMMALGLSGSFSDSALLTISIALHQPAESIALLVAFLKSGLSKRQIVLFLSLFSCMGPIGVGLGMLVNEYAAPIVDSIMLAIVAGTFVYVGATEVIPEEWEDSRNKWKKFAALMSGIVSIFAITQYTMTLGH